MALDLDTSPAQPGDPGAEVEALEQARIDTWEGRVALQGAAYTSPSGSRHVFDFGDVERKHNLRGTVYGFPGVNEQYVQRKGFGSRVYPMRCFFTGNDHDVLATRFEAALLEDGIGTLEHPMHGVINNVVPFGDITRTDALVTAANQSVVEVTFWRTTGAVYPSARSDAASEVQSALEAYADVAAQGYATQTKLDTEERRANTKAGVKSLLSSVSNSLNSVSDTVSTVRNAFADGVATVNQGIDVLIGQPLLLARQIVDLTKAPARALDGIQSRLEAYGRLSDSIFGSDQGTPQNGLIHGNALAARRDRLTNDWQSANLFAGAAMSGAVTASLSHEYTSKPEALLAAATIQAQWDATTAWRDAGFEALEVFSTSTDQTDTGSDYQALQEAVAIAVGRLIEISFSLLPERRKSLDRARTIIDLCAELYGTVSDERLNFLINTNRLTGSEILELPKGKTIVYYAA